MFMIYFSYRRYDFGGRYKTCAFGQFYYSLGQEIFNSIPGMLDNSLIFSAVAT